MIKRIIKYVYMFIFVKKMSRKINQKETVQVGSSGELGLVKPERGGKPSIFYINIFFTFKISLYTMHVYTLILFAWS